LGGKTRKREQNINQKLLSGAHRCDKCLYDDDDDIKIFRRYACEELKKK